MAKSTRKVKMKKEKVTMTRDEAEQALKINQNGHGYSTFWECYSEYCYWNCKDGGLLVDNEIPDSEWTAGVPEYEQIWIENYMDMTVDECEELNRDRLQKERDDEKKELEARRWAAQFRKRWRQRAGGSCWIEEEVEKLFKLKSVSWKK